MTDIDLPAAELDVMSCVWQGVRTSAEIRQALADARPMSHPSVCTLLKRLEVKGFVVREKGPVGKAFLYSPAVQPTFTRKSLLGGVLDRLFGGDGVALVASLLETRPPTNDELNSLETLLKELRAKRASRQSMSKQIQIAAKRRKGS